MLKPETSHEGCTQTVLSQRLVRVLSEVSASTEKKLWSGCRPDSRVLHKRNMTRVGDKEHGNIHRVAVA